MLIDNGQTYSKSVGQVGLRRTYIIITIDYRYYLRYYIGGLGRLNPRTPLRSNTSFILEVGTVDIYNFYKSKSRSVSQLLIIPG